jgi:hypothetical protein
MPSEHATAPQEATSVRRPGARWLPVLLGVLLATGSAAAESVVIERVLAVVDRRPVLLSEAEVVAALRGLERHVALDALIDELLMYTEAARYPHARPTPEEEQAALASLTARRPEPRLEDADLRRIAHRQATILKYVGLRFRPLVRISDEQLRLEYATRYPGPPGAPGFEAVADELRVQLAGRELDVRIEEWVRQLRAAVEIRYVDETADAPRP